MSSMLIYHLIEIYIAMCELRLILLYRKQFFQSIAFVIIYY